MKTFSKGNLLLIDDEELILKKTKIILEDYADNIFTAISGKDGIEIVKNETIHCIICDINMPEMNGIDVIKKIREGNIDVPFVFYTGHGSHKLMREAIKYGAFDFLDKPGLDGLEEVVQRGLKQGIQESNTDDNPESSFESEYKKLINSQK